MSFASRLPEGARGVEDYIVYAPEGGLSDKINEILLGRTPFLDLSIERDLFTYMIRVVLQPDGLRQKHDSTTLFLLESAAAVFLDEYDQMTGDLVTVTGLLNKEVVSQEAPAGQLTIWKSKFRESGVA